MGVTQVDVGGIGLTGFDIARVAVDAEPADADTSDHAVADAGHADAGHADADPDTG